LDVRQTGLLSIRMELPSPTPKQTEPGSVMKRWYLVRTQPRREHLAKSNLERQGYETYLPLIQESRRRRGHWVDVVEPLFARYLFVRLAVGLDNFGPIRYTTGVHNLVRFGEEFSVVPDHTVDALLRSADRTTGIHQPKHALFEPGNSVFIEQGPFAGLRAIFLAETAQERAVILVEMLGRANRVVVERYVLRVA
jgi:transcriptional antiterminator RfaH